MPRRRGRPGLIGTAARTAVVVGTANADDRQRAAARHAAAGGLRAQHQAIVDQAAAQAAAQVAAQTAPPPAAYRTGDLIGKLKELADLKSAGVLTDEEFSAAKARLLG